MVSWVMPAAGGVFGAALTRAVAGEDGETEGVDEPAQSRGVVTVHADHLSGRIDQVVARVARAWARR